jgi:hypothetical protein
MVNAAVNTKVLLLPGYAETTSMGVRYVLLLVPLALYGLYVIRRMAPRSIVPQAA